jgi:hypothetical protein
MGLKLWSCNCRAQTEMILTELGLRKFSESRFGIPFPESDVRAESRFPNPTVRAGSAGGLKRGTVVSHTDRRTK